MRSKTRKEGVLRFKKGGEKSFDNAKCYVRFCTNDYIGCKKPCKHVVNVNPHSILPVTGLHLGNDSRGGKIRFYKGEGGDGA